MLKKLENTAKEFTSLDDYLTVSIIRVTKKLNELADAHNELLGTHIVKGETATPDKHDVCCFCPCDCHQNKLPTSSYEVTCGRREKSIKHSCGRV